MKGVAGSFVLVGLLVACTSIPNEGPSCMSDGCGPHGTCSFAGRCVCEKGYAGPTCVACAPGFQDVDGNGLCAPACASVSCGPHARCSDASGRPVCTCVVGYSSVNGRCVFTGGPVDPSFDDPRPNGWVTRGAAQIDTGKPVLVNGGNGWARFSGRGEVRQWFEMPSYAEAEPLALELESTCSWQGGACRNVRRRYSVAFDDRILEHRTVGPSLSEIRRICLGESAFGRGLTFAVRTYSASTPRGRSEDVFFGRAEFVPWEGCAAPGTVKNGDFETGDWRVPDEGQVDFVEEDGTRLARVTSFCDPAHVPPMVVSSMVTSISVPEALPRPALSFTIDATSDGHTSVTLDGVSIGTVLGNGAKETAVLCLPQWTRGLAFELAIQATLRRETCAKEERNVVRVDDFTVTSDPSCVDETVTNGGFERPGPSGLGLEDAVIVRDAAAARSGDAYLRLHADCVRRARARAFAEAAVPARASDASGGPALKLWYRLPAAAPAYVIAGDELIDSNRHNLSPATGWTKGTFCLPSHSWGRRAAVDIELNASFDDFGTCVSTVLDLDDLSIAPDPSCPPD
ncbi:MAG: hypothetical protein BGO98_32495 [Myxococcales bacterium 68-20]|nr:MAG: hypothetical protein BGO98_32495 [Myxococcales bacterium 68-20]